MKNLSIKAKLLLAFLFVLAINVVSGIVTHNLVNSLRNDVANITTNNIPNILSLAEIRYFTKDAYEHIMEIALNDQSHDGMQNTLVEMEKELKLVEKASVEYTSQEWNPGEKPLWDVVDEKLKSYKETLTIAVDTARSAPDDKRKELVVPIIRQITAKSDALDDAITKLTDYHKTAAHKLSQDADESGKQVNLGLLVAISIASIIGLALGYFISSDLSRKLTLLVKDLENQVQQLSQGAARSQTTSHDLSSATHEQASAIQETAASCDEVSAMVSKNSDNAEKSRQLSKSSLDTANRGKEAVRDVISSLDDISRANDEILRQVEDSNREIGDIVKVIAEIGSKTKVINDIVFQTKLLSFNASVEAARAGEHGKGFAVVAEEVGNLAQMSGNAAKEISSMLDDSIKKVEGIAQNTGEKVERLVRQSRDKMGAGTNTVHRCNTVLEEIVGNVSNLDVLVSEITVASREQAQGVGEITKAVGQMDQAVSINATSAEQCATASHSLNLQANAIQNIVNLLNITVHGGENHKSTEEPRINVPSLAAEPSTKREPSPRLPAKRSSAPSSKDSAYNGPSVVVPLRSSSHPERQTPAAKLSSMGSSNQALKKAAGSVLENVPSENDPRFEDV